MGKTITGSGTIGVTLSVNPTTIAGTIATTLTDAVFGPAAKAWTLVNDGTVFSSAATGVYLDGGGKITNAKHGFIGGASDAIAVLGQANISNAGTIVSSAPYGAGILVDDYVGLSVVAALAASSAGSAIRITNSAGGVITGDVGIEVIGTATVLNQGLIESAGAYGGGVFLFAGTLDNAKGGTIIGRSGVALGNAGTIIDAGLIESTGGSSGYAVRMGSSAGNELILQAGARLIGGIYGFIAGETIDEAALTITSESFSNGVLTLFDKTAIVGTLDFESNLNASAFTLKTDGHAGTDIVLGTETFTGSYTGGVGLAALTNVIAAGARVAGVYEAVYGSRLRDWTLANQGTIIAQDAGVLLEGSGFVSNAVHGLIEGDVGIRISGGTLADAGTIIGTNGAAIYLGAGTGGTDIVLQSGAKLQGGIYGFVAGDTIDLAGVTATGEIFGGGILTLTNGGAVAATVALDGVFNTGGFKLASLAGGTGIIAAPGETFTGHYGAPLRLSSVFTSIAASGSFHSTGDGVVGEGGGAGWTLLNAGTLSAADVGIRLVTGQVTNAVGGRISGDIGVSLDIAVLSNAGSISGAAGIGIGDGLEQFSGATSRNLAGGSIYGGATGAALYGGSFANAGTVFGPVGVNLSNGTFSNTGRVTGMGGNSYQTYRDLGLNLYAGFASNAASGVIAGPTGARVTNGVLVNAGKIFGLPGGYKSGLYGGRASVASKGLDLAGGIVTNTSTGTISGAYGVALDAGTLVDAGTIASIIAGTGIAIAFGTVDATLVLDQGNVIVGAVSNFLDGDVIDFAATKITTDHFSKGILTLINGSAIVEKISLTGFLNQQDFTLISQGSAGTELVIGREIINASYATGISLSAPTTITKTGTIASSAGTAIYGSAARTWTLLNQGVITAEAAEYDQAVVMKAGATITNAAGALIEAAFIGVNGANYKGSTVLNNAGTILATGAGFNAAGVVLGANAVVTNTGLIKGKTGLIVSAFSTITNAGTIASTLAGGIAVNMNGLGNQLILDAGAKIIGNIGGFSNDDVIDFAGQTITGKSFDHGTLTLTDGGVTLATLGFAGGQNASEFSIASDGAGGTKLVLGPEILTGTYQYGITLSANVTTIAAGALVEVLAGHAGPGNPSGYALVDNTAAATTIVNDGRIIDTYYGKSGVFASGATITNAAGGTISGSAGIKLFGGSGSPGSINNAGVIIGTRAGGYGLDLSFGFMSNQKTGFVTGDAGLFLYDATLNNAGTVIGRTYSGVIVTSAFGSVDNLAGGTIEGVSGVAFQQAGTLTNAGTIESSLGTSGTAVKFGAQAARFIDDPGGVLIGGVTAGNNGTFGDLLELASGASAGTLTGTLAGIGESITGFGTIAFDPKSAWTLRGDSAGLAGGQTITGFSSTDTIILDNFSASSFSTIAGGLLLKNAGGTITLDITTTLAGAFAIHAAGTSTTITAAAATKMASASDIVTIGALSSTSIAMSFMRPAPRPETMLQPLAWPAHATGAAAAAAAPAPQIPSIGWLLSQTTPPAALPVVTLHSG